MSFSPVAFVEDNSHGDNKEYAVVADPGWLLTGLARAIALSPELDELSGVISRFISRCERVGTYVADA